MPTVAYPSSLFALNMKYPGKPKEGFLAIPMQLNFYPTLGAAAITGYTINLSNAGSQQGSGFSQLCTLFIDNSESSGDTVVQVIGSGITISARAYTRGFYPVSASNLNIVVTNDAPVNSQVEVVAYNYIVNPVIDQQIPSNLGNGDAIIAQRIGNVSQIAEIPLSATANTITQMGAFGPPNSQYPYYYLTDIMISVTQPSSGVTAFRLVDLNVSSLAVQGTFTSIQIGPGSTGLQMNLAGVCLTGNGIFGFQQISGVTGGGVSVTIFGGRTATPVTSAQFAPIT